MKAMDLKRKGLEKSMFGAHAKGKGRGDVGFRGRDIGYIMAHHASREAKATENPKRHHVNPSEGRLARRNITSPSVISAGDCQVS